MDVIVMKSGDCDRCAGCGYVANTPDAEPWKYWAELPTQSAVAISMGWVRPIECPECKGSGEGHSESLKGQSPGTIPGEGCVPGVPGIPTENKG